MQGAFTVSMQCTVHPFWAVHRHAPWCRLPPKCHMHLLCSFWYICECVLCAHMVMWNLFTRQGTALSTYDRKLVCLLVQLVAYCCLLCLQGQNGADLHDSIKRYRQSIFKLTYKLKKTKQNHKARHKILVLQNAAERVLAVQKQEVWCGMRRSIRSHGGHVGVQEIQQNMQLQHSAMLVSP